MAVLPASSSVDEADLDQIAGFDQVAGVRSCASTGWTPSSARRVASRTAPARRLSRDRRAPRPGRCRPPAIGRDQRSCRKPSSVCFSVRTLRCGLRQMPRRLSTTPQAAIDGAVGRRLELEVERRADGEAVLVERLGAVLGLEVLAHFLDEVRREARPAGGLAGHDDRLLPRRVGRLAAVMKPSAAIRSSA